MGGNDTFLLSAYADLLLRQKRPAAVNALLKDKTRSDTLLLQLVLAARALGLAEAKQLQSTLVARYEASRLRGEAVHQQEEARFALEVENEPKRALALAKENWKVQREPRDAQVFLEAAIAANNREAARPMQSWLEENHVEDRYLNNLSWRLKRIAK